MKKKSSGGEGGGANWMDTYGDMVTLLLCFFVLLYSMSTVDQTKWKMVALSFNPNAIPSKTDPVNGFENGPFQDEDLSGNPGVSKPEENDENEEKSQQELAQEAIDQAMEDLFEKIKEYVDETGVNIEVTKGDGGVFLSMRDTIFFRGNEWELLPAGHEVLEHLAPIITECADSIDQIRVMGHTAQVLDDGPNDIYFDWQLSSMRAVEVIVALQELCPELDPARWKTEGNGQYLPVAPNDNETNRQKNRRVEMIIKGKDLMDLMGDSIEQYQTLRTDGPSKDSVSHDGSAPESSAPESGSAESSAAEPSGTESQEG